MQLSDYRLIVIGSGFYGATIARRAADELALPVLVVERRGHTGGNSYSETDPATGVEYHKYGSHLFHTSSELVWNFITRFTAFNNYRHRVFAKHRGRVYTMPINLMTINSFFGLDLSPSEARALIGCQAAEEGITTPRNLEEKAIQSVGRPLYEALVKGYTIKQWQTDPTLLPPEIVARLPVRFSFDDFYFSDTHEGLPTKGYSPIFSQMLCHPKIDVAVNCDFFDIRDQIPPRTPIVYTGPIDRYFNCDLGELGWRTLDFELERLDIADFQGAAVINYPDVDVPYTRIHEFRHLHPERHYIEKTLVMREYSRFAGRGDEPYYPIGRREDKLLYEQYRLRGLAEPNVVFAGRLGTYRYIDMHQAIASALIFFENELSPRLTGRSPAARGIA